MDIKGKIWSNHYVDIWSLVTIDQHTVDKERRMTEFEYDHKLKVAKKMNNWLQEFAVLGCIMGQKHPERCSQLFVYPNAYKTHGRMASAMPRGPIGPVDGDGVLLRNTSDLPPA